MCEMSQRTASKSTLTITMRNRSVLSAPLSLLLLLQSPYNHAFVPNNINKSLLLQNTQLNSFADALQLLQSDNTLTPSWIGGALASAPMVGEADRAFRQGIQLEKNGQARAASVAFHEAATLYKCFLDNGKDFGHVTALDADDIAAVLAYTCVRLAHVNHDALGDSKAAMRLYKDASEIDPQPSCVSLDGVGTSIEASGGKLQEAVVAYREAHRLAPDNMRIMFHLAVALERLGVKEEAEELMDRLRRCESEHSCLVDSWGYVRWHTRKVPNELNNLHQGTRAMLQIALDAAMPLINQGGWVCEFGVASGRSMRMTQEIVPLDVAIHGFDSFEGIPIAWGNEPKGSYSTGGVIPNLEGQIYFHKGLFGETIPVFLKEAPKDGFLAYANIDCDLYTSTLDILEGMHGRIVPGTILVFDEYLCHPTWRQDEFRAWRECCKRFGWEYEYLGFSLSTKQAVVRVTDA